MTEPLRPSFGHLRRMTDRVALFEHADHDRPRPEHAYCLDDVSRALVVVVREGDPGLADLLHLYLGVTLYAVADDGTCHNRLNLDGTWADSPSLGDWWGRAVWALGVTARHGPTGVRKDAAAGFLTLARRRSPFRRALAYAALGAAELIQAPADDPYDPAAPVPAGAPGDPALGAAARALLTDAVAAVLAPASGHTPSDDWPWPEPRLTYGNALLPEALLAGGSALSRWEVVESGLTWLDFLIRTETVDDHLSVTPVGGRGPGESGPAFDQQPIEVAGIADACARAWQLTGDPWWAEQVRRAWEWFLGHNDSGAVMYDGATGAGHDGLLPTGHNENRGAESTLAAISTLQQAREVGVRECQSEWSVTQINR